MKNTPLENKLLNTTANHFIQPLFNQFGLVRLGIHFSREIDLLEKAATHNITQHFKIRKLRFFGSTFLNDAVV